MNRKIETLGYNLSDDETCNLDAEGDLDAVADPGIGPLEDNGGPTLTYALLEGSPAIDSGDNDPCPNNDQRGSIRPADGNEDGTFICDIGAFELFPGYTDLHINNLTAPDQVFRGATVPIMVEAHNTGIDPVTSVVIETMLSEQLTVVEATFSINDGDPSACTASDGTVTCAIGTMAFDDVAMVDIEASASSVGTASIETMATSPDDSDETNNSASADVLIIGVADMQLEASADPSTVKVGATVVVTGVVTNNGPDDASNVRVTSELPTGMTFVSVSTDTGSCVESGGLLDCEIGSMAASGPSASIELELTADVAGTIDVTLVAGADESDADVENNAGSATITVNEPSGGKCAAGTYAGAADSPWPGVMLLSLLVGMAWRRRMGLAS
jgi:uncharacterized repeat protein (TIGR01451 family)